MDNFLQTKEGSKKHFKDYVFFVALDGNESAPLNSENIMAETKSLNIPEFILEYLGFKKSLIPKDHSLLTELALEKHLVASGTCAGNYIFLPKGQCIIDTLQSYEKFTLSQFIPVFDFKVPVIFEPHTESLHTLTERFSAGKFNRMVSLAENSNRYLRYAADPDVFNYLENMVFDARQLPFILYSSGETARNDDEIAGIIRTISFGQPDYHAITSYDNYFDVYMQLHKTTNSMMKKMFSQHSLFIIIDIEKSYLSTHPNIIQEIQKVSQLPVLVNVLKEKTHYYSVQHQYYMKLETGHFIQIGNLQVDFENGKNLDSKGKKRFNVSEKNGDIQRSVVIIHGLITGRDSRLLAGLLNDCVIEQKSGGKPTFPFELSPYQVRIISHNKNTAQFSDSLARALLFLSSNQLRVMVDNRDVELRQKIKDAGRDWVPFIIVIGEKEIKLNNYSINNRYINSSYAFSTSECDVNELSKKIMSYLNSDDNNSYRFTLPSNLSLPNPFNGVIDYGLVPIVFS